MNFSDILMVQITKLCSPKHLSHPLLCPSSAQQESAKQCVPDWGPSPSLKPYWFPCAVPSLYPTSSPLGGYL